jgi:bacteriorhodopsin
MRARRQFALWLWIVVALLLVLMVVGAARGNDQAPRTHRCTHGVSSIGPVQIANGKIIGGSTTPHTEACLR